MKVLIAEDEPVSRKLLERLLGQWGHEVTSTRDGAEALAALQQEGGPRLVVLDWMMPGMDGPAVCRRIRQWGDEPYFYLILLTAKAKPDDVVAGLDAGADDYLTKPFDPHELKVRIRAGRRILDLQGELISAREELREQAARDGLTGLWNRGAVLDLLQSELARTRREDTCLAVAMADLDRFKRVNDAHGHLVGDAVLRAAAGRLVSSLRPYDAVGRYGGEEFLVVAPVKEPGVAAALGERLRLCVGERAIGTEAGEVRITISVGMAVTGPDRAWEAGEIVRAADAALYRAKERGRDRVEVAMDSDYAPNGACTPARECAFRASSAGPRTPAVKMGGMDRGTR